MRLLKRNMFCEYNRRTKRHVIKKDRTGLLERLEKMSISCFCVRFRNPTNAFLMASLPLVKQANISFRDLLFREHGYCCHSCTITLTVHFGQKLKQKISPPTKRPQVIRKTSTRCMNLSPLCWLYRKALCLCWIQFLELFCYS